MISSLATTFFAFLLLSGTVSTQRIDVGTTLSTEYILNTIWDSTTQTQIVVNTATQSTTQFSPLSITVTAAPIPVLTSIPVTVTAAPIPVLTSILIPSTVYQDRTIIDSTTLVVNQTDFVTQMTTQLATITESPVTRTNMDVETFTQSLTATETIPCSTHEERSVTASAIETKLVTVLEPTLEIETKTMIPITISLTNSATPDPFTTTIDQLTTIDAVSLLTSLFVTRVPSSIEIFPTATVTQGGAEEETATTTTTMGSATAVATPTCSPSFTVATTSKRYFLRSRSSRHCKMTEIESSRESAEVSQKICAPVFVKSWETNDYNGTCLALYPGGAGDIVPAIGGCGASLSVLCN